MDFLVSQVTNDTLITEALDDETYPGLKVYEMTEAQRDAVNEVINTKHLSPIISEEPSEDEASTIVTPIEEKSVMPAPTLPTPNVFAKIPAEKFVEELTEEVSQLRRKVAMTANMKSLMAKLNGLEDINTRIELIKSYSERKFNIVLTTNDFESLTPDQIQSIYKKTRDSEKSDRFELIYKTAFDFGVRSLETILNKYCFKVNRLSDYILYEDISSELNDLKYNLEETVVGKYVDHTSPVMRIISYLVIQITRSKLNV